MFNCCDETWQKLISPEKSNPMACIDFVTVHKVANTTPFHTQGEIYFRNLISFQEIC